MKEEKHKNPEYEMEIRHLKTALEELSVLNDLAVAAGSSTETGQTLDVILQKSIKAVRAEQGSISLVTEQKDNPFHTLIRQVDRSKTHPVYHIGSHITGWVLKNKQALRIESLAGDRRFCASEEECRAIRSVLCVPIWCQARIIGILMMTNKKTGEPFDDGDLRLLSIIAAQSGQLIRNSQLQAEAVEKKRMEHELALARRIQSSLLPFNAPQSDRLEIAAWYQPAVEVGGDFYDYFVFDDRTIGVTIADVSGHGPSAAMMTSMLKGIFHTIIHQVVSPDSALSEMNLILSQTMPRGIFVTMMVLIFDVDGKVLQFSNAGHNPMIHFDGDSGSCEMIELPGCALNLVKGFKYGLRKVPLKKGDVFLIYTDGITEAVNEKSEMFETARLAQIVQESASGPCSKMIEQVKKCLISFTGKTIQEDDLLMIAIRVK